MNFSDLSAHEKAVKTYRDIQKRKAEKGKGRKAADEHLYANSIRIKKALREIKRRGICVR